MSLFPVIQSPCPYKGDIADILEANQCRLCQREVHDLSRMIEAERLALVSRCEDDEGLCVRYTVRGGLDMARAALGFGALGAAALAMPAFAQTAPEQTQPAPQPSAPTVQPAVEQSTEPEDIWIIVGGLRAPEKAKWIRHRASPKDESPRAGEAPALPVIYEENVKQAGAPGKPQRAG